MTVEIPLWALDGSVRAWATIDLADLPEVDLHRWHLHGQGYAATDRGRVLLHRFLLGLEPGDEREGDHRDRDRLNYRRANLRIVTHANNAQNMMRSGGTSRHRGVSWSKRRQKWRAEAMLNYRTHVLGYFTDEDEAGRVAAEWRAENMPFSHADRSAA